VTWDLIDNGQIALILKDAVADLAGVLVFLVADRGPVIVRRGDADEKRLRAVSRREARLQDVDQLAVGLNVKLIHDCDMCVTPVFSWGVGRDYAQVAVVALAHDRLGLAGRGVAAVELAARFELGLRLDHAAAVAEEDAGLLLVAGGDESLLAALGISEKHQQGDSR